MPQHLVLITGRMPPTDGESKWRFPQGSVMLRADSLEKLIAEVFEYRLRNHIEIGDIERDIQTWYCRSFPSFCAGGNAVRTNDTEPMLNRISRWASQMARMMPKGGYELELTKTAEARAEICMACPKNVGWRGSCGACSASTLQLLQQIKSLRKTNRDGNLSACLVGGWENGAGVHMKPEQLRVSEEQREELPEKCWRKALA